MFPSEGASNALLRFRESKAKHGGRRGEWLPGPTFAIAARPGLCHRRAGGAGSLRPSRMTLPARKSRDRKDRGSRASGSGYRARESLRSVFSMGCRDEKSASLIMV